MSIETLLHGTLIETEQMVLERQHKLCLIEDVYKLEKACGLKKTDFYKLYDLNEETLINMVAALTSHYKSNQRNLSLSRY